MSTFQTACVQDWTIEQVKEWIKSLKMPDKMKEEVTLKIDEYEITGTTLDNINDQDDVQDSFDIKKIQFFS